MKTINILKIESSLCLAGSIGLLAWWFMMPLLLPTGDASHNFENLVLDPDWIGVNMLGFISIILLILGFPGYYLKQFEKYHTLGFTGIVTSITGLILYACIQYYETIIWPAAARVNPDLLQVKGALVSGDPVVVSGLLVSGVILGLGYILFGIASIKARSFPKVPVWLLMIGVPLFGNAVVFPARTVGLLLFAAGNIWLALDLRRK